jgi:hypothetical protein
MLWPKDYGAPPPRSIGPLAEQIAEQLWVEIRLSNYIQIRLHTRSKCSQITFNNDASTLVCSK